MCLGMCMCAGAYVRAYVYLYLFVCVCYLFCFSGPLATDLLYKFIYGENISNSPSRKISVINIF